MKKFKRIQISSLDKSFEEVRFEDRPSVGWLKTIRNAISMPLGFLSDKLGVSKQAISKLEKSEAEGTVSLKSLRQVAEAMDCELHYMIVPRNKSLQKIIDRRALEKAAMIIDEVDKTMILEDQKISDSKSSIKLLAKDLSDNLNSKLWSDESN